MVVGCQDGRIEVFMKLTIEPFFRHLFTVPLACPGLTSLCLKERRLFVWQRAESREGPYLKTTRLKAWAPGEILEAEVLNQQVAGLHGRALQVSFTPLRNQILVRDAGNWLSFF
jgi:hypothetical protein